MMAIVDLTAASQRGERWQTWLLGAALARPEYLRQTGIPLWVWPHRVLLFILAVILLKLLHQ